MKITGLKKTIVSVPFSKPYTWRMGKGIGITSVLVELTTDDGIVGYGESPCPFPPAESFKAAVDTSLPRLLGEDPSDHERIYKWVLRLKGLYYDRIFAGLVFSGVDLALWDLMGKASGKPIYKLIGGAVHGEARFICIVPLADPRAMAENAQRAVDDGCQTIYVKYDGEEQQLTHRLEAIRATVGPNVKLRVDFNQGLSPGFAVKFIKELAKFDLEAVEQPCGEEDLAGMRYIRQSINTPLISDESFKTFNHTFNTTQTGAADIIEVDHYTTDGIWGVQFSRLEASNETQSA